MNVKVDSKRNTNHMLDIIRVVAMSGVLVDHFLQSTNSPTLVNLGIFIGGACVAIFVFLSAFLFGRKWDMSNFEHFNPKFFSRKRFIRVFIPLWISLLLIIPVEKFVTGNVDIYTIAFNFAGLGWARPFVTSGHLWYITLLILVYCLIVACSYVKIKIPTSVWIVAILGLSETLFLFPSLFSSFSRAGIPLTLLLSGFMFFKSNEIISFCKKHMIAFVILTIGITIIFGYLNGAGLLDDHKAIAALSYFICGFMVIVCFLGFHVGKDSQIVHHLASISYEVYLIHLPLMPLLGYFIRYQLLFVPLWLLSTYILSLSLHLVTSKLNGKIKIQRGVI